MLKEMKELLKMFRNFDAIELKLVWLERSLASSKARKELALINLLAERGVTQAYESV